MGTIIRRNERSWAIVIITEIKMMLNGLGLKIKSAGGESTLSVNKKSMFPDVLLYEDEAQTKILQGWELKMPDVLITDEALIADATRKAKALGLNSFVIWNFTYGKLYVENENGNFEEAKVWSGTKHIKSREDVMTYKAEWLPIIKEIVMTVNEYLVNGIIETSSIVNTVSEGLMTELIQRNKELVAENITIESSKNMPMESRLKVWWNAFHEEYDKDENNMYSAYAKSVLLNWTNRIMFANAIKRYHNCAYMIKDIDYTTSPNDGNIIIEHIVEQGDFYNVFKPLEFNEIIPEDTWIDIVDYNQFLIENNIEKIEQRVLQDILEKTVNTAKREIRGQYATPYYLADILCQITVQDWNKDCADLCAGTGTIAKAIINNKFKRINNANKAFSTTWMSDKYAYPLQIANIAVTDIHALNIPINMFQTDVFDVQVGDKIEIKNPTDGSGIVKNIPQFGAIVSNLPFVEYNKVAIDEQEYIAQYREKIINDTGIEFTRKTDLYNYLPFKLYELLEKDGKLGIIVSNSWLGTDIGKKFFEAMQFYYIIESVVISNCKKWFDNADVIGTILVLKKKEISAPDKTKKISFWLTNKDIHSIENEDKEMLINSIVLHEVIDESVATMREYSISDIDNITQHGISMNALFHNISWVKDIEDFIEPIENELSMIRGERTGQNEVFYIKGETSIADKFLYPMLKSSRNIKKYTASSDMKAFCCDRTIDQLKEDGEEGTLKWIRKFCDNNYEPIPKSINYSPWYQMPSTNRADLVTSENPDKRLFIAELSESVLVDQRLIAMKYKDSVANRDLVFALLNSLYGMFAIEANGFGRGQGVLDISKTGFQKICMINPNLISKEDSEEIIELFSKIKNCDVMDIQDELSNKDRQAFDKKVLQSIGHEELYDCIKESLLSMQHTRHCVK
ncbi:Eco57I restriction-modification methylase domain-containing protein [Roseburia hominis]